MAAYDSDSSLSDAGDDISTNVTLGYASKEPTDDIFSQLGGTPSFFDGTFPSASLVRCKCCNSNMSLLLQLHGDMKSRFPNHERRLYLWSCRQKQCRRKDGSVRGFRGVRVARKDAANGTAPKVEMAKKPMQNIGSQLFGGGSIGGSSNPFSSTSTSSATNGPSNPFSAASASTSTSSASEPRTATESANEDLPTTFAQKARISSPNAQPAPSKPTPHEAWPETSFFPPPYPSFHLDADTEYLSPSSTTDTSAPSSSHTAFMDIDNESAFSSKDDANMEAEAEMTHDKTFQHFADRVSQNDEQILRYEYGGEPLLYSRSDAVGRLFTTQAAGSGKVTTTGKTARGIPACANCGASRMFECQLMPHAIAELESGEEAATLLSNGMEWGTILLGVCSKDCSGAEVPEGKGVSYVEEWVGVQWEEVVKRKR